MLEFKTLVLALNDPSLQQVLKQLEEAGWIMVPGVSPQVIYVICRPLQQPLASGEGFGQLKIDESKMYFIDQNGNRQDRH